MHIVTIIPYCLGNNGKGKNLYIFSTHVMISNVFNPLLIELVKVEHIDIEELFI
jgi:hypothetical protein